MPSKTDQEVKVTVTPKPNGVVSVDALSLDHKITKIIVWDSQGNLASRRGVDGSENTTVSNQTGPDGIQHNHDSYSVKNDSSPVASFPICVDIYEAGDSEGVPEGADVHRHGWFDQNGNPVDAKDHPLDPNHLNDRNKKGYYPTISEHTSGGSEIDSPGAYQKK